jgi:hypothetical protein
MKEKDLILEKILLNMKYDSRKTLSENEQSLNNTKKEKAADGSDLILPLNAKVTQRYSCSYFAEQYSNKPDLVIQDVPQFLEACKVKFQLKEKTELDNCVMNYMNIRISKCVDGAVASFTVDNINYNGCTTIKNRGQWLDPENLIFSGYYGKSQDIQIDPSSGCSGKKWEFFEPKKEEKYGIDLKQGNVIDDKPGERPSGAMRFYLPGGIK